MIKHYTLNDKGEPVACDLEGFIKLYKTDCTNDKLRRVAYETVGNSDVSTVFLGLDYRFGSKGPPILWETLVFGGKMDQEMTRCSGSREQAVAMHQKMVARVKKGLKREHSRTT